MSNFTSVLKKIGQVLLTASGVATEVMGFPFLSQILSGAAGQKVASTVTTVTGDFNAIAQIVSLMEVAFPVSGSGSQKLAGAAPVVQQIVLNWAQSNLPGHNTVKTDAATFAAHCAALTSDFANLMNDFGA